MPPIPITKLGRALSEEAIDPLSEFLSISSGDEPLFEAITSRSPPFTVGTTTKNALKNAFLDIVPFDHRLVPLPSGSYINASFIRSTAPDPNSVGDDNNSGRGYGGGGGGISGYKYGGGSSSSNALSSTSSSGSGSSSSMTRGYIATQGPRNTRDKRSTTGEFFEMVFAHSVSVVVMLCAEGELMASRGRYWGDVGAGPRRHGGYAVECVSEDTSHARMGITVSRCRVTDLKRAVERMRAGAPPVRGAADPEADAAVRDIVHVRYEAWKDYDVTTIEGLRVLLNVVDMEHHGWEKGGPILVHCRAGVGRSGTFIGVHNILANVRAEVEAGTPPEEIFIDPEAEVRRMRESRMLCVQTENQFKFLYFALNRFIDELMRERGGEYGYEYEQDAGERTEASAYGSAVNYSASEYSNFRGSYNSDTYTFTDEERQERLRAGRGGGNHTTDDDNDDIDDDEHHDHRNSNRIQHRRGNYHHYNSHNSSGSNHTSSTSSDHPGNESMSRNKSHDINSSSSSSSNNNNNNNNNNRNYGNLPGGKGRGYDHINHINGSPNQRWRSSRRTSILSNVSASEAYTDDEHRQPSRRGSVSFAPTSPGQGHWTRDAPSPASMLTGSERGGYTDDDNDDYHRRRAPDSRRGSLGYPPVSPGLWPSGASSASESYTVDEGDFNHRRRNTDGFTDDDTDSSVSRARNDFRNFDLNTDDSRSYD